MFQWLQSFWSKPTLQNHLSPWDQFTFKLIHQIKYNRTPLKVTFQDHPESFASAILAIDADQQIMLLDPLFPSTGNDLIKVGKSIDIQCVSHGIHIGFSCPIIRQKMRQDLSGFCVKFPEVIDYQQKRDAYRVRVPEDYDLDVSFALPNELVIAKVLDLSMTGMQLKLDRPLAYHLDEHNIIQEARMIRPNSPHMAFDFKVVHQQCDEGENSAILGCEFYNLAKSEQAWLNQIVVSLQRIQQDWERGGFGK